MLTRRPAASEGKVPRGTVAFYCVAMGLCLSFIAVAVARIAGLDIPSPLV